MFRLYFTRGSKSGIGKRPPFALAQQLHQLPLGESNWLN